MINKNLFITVRDNTNIHPDIIENIKKIKKNNINYKLYIVDNDEFEEMLKKYKPSWLPFFKKLNPNLGAMIGDYIRYVLLYLFGGIYIDCKSKCKVSFENIIKDNENKPIFFRWDTVTNNEILNFFLISPVNHQVYLDMIEKIHENIINFDQEEWMVHRSKSNVLKFTGPHLLTKIVEKYVEKYKDYVIIKDDSWRRKCLIYATIKNHKEKIDGQHYSIVKEHLVI
jgi:inositol phosphorylceramide mannosyltransferase catalytic subunit